MFRRFSVALVLVTAAACGGKSPSAPSDPVPSPVAPSVTSVTVNGGGCSTGGTCTAAENFSLTAIAQLSDGTTKNVTSVAQWNSSNSGIADVSGTGAVAVHNQGSTDISATYQGRLAGTTVIVPAPWSANGTGDTVFDMPKYISRVRITGHYASHSSNFIVHIGSAHVVNELVGTSWNQVDFAGTYLTSGGVVEIVSSSGVQWTFTQVRQ